VGFAAGVEELGVDACAVVADGYAQFAGGIFDFDFDLFGLGMAQGVEKRLAGDQEICCRTPGSTGFGHPIFAIRRRARSAGGSSS